MGIVARQSFKAAIATYLGIGMGVLNNLIIYPLVLKVEEYGEIQFIIQSAAFFTPFLMFGTGSVLTRFFPNYKEDENAKSLFIGGVASVVAINVVVFLALFAIFKEDVYGYYGDKSGVSNTAVLALVLCSAILPFITLLKNYSAIHGRIAIPSSLDQVFKFFLPLAAIGYFLSWYDLDILLISVAGYYMVLLVIFLIYSNSLSRLRLKFKWHGWRSLEGKRAMLYFSLFSVVSGVGVTLTNQVDILMVTKMQGTYQNGLYTWALFIANAIAIPYVLVGNVSIPIIAQYWKDGNTEGVRSIYTKSSSSLLVLSLGVLCSFWLIIDDLFLIMPRGSEFALAKYVVLLLAVAKILDMSAGLNSQILSMSDRYRSLLYMLGIAVLLNVGLNLVMIPKYGIIGSAIATVVSVLVFNLMKLYYIYRHYGMQPYQWKSLLTIVLAALSYMLVSAIPHTASHLVNLILFSCLGGVIYFSLAYKLKLSSDINQFVNKQLSRFGLRSFD